MERTDFPMPAGDGPIDQPLAPLDAADAADAADVARAMEMVRLAQDYSHPPRRRRVMLPVVLFLATCGSTFWTAATDWNPIYYLYYPDRVGQVIQQHWQQGLTYMVAVLGILLTHEMGHFLMTVRYRIPASFPHFIPMPVLFGTLGAVIGMEGSRANRRQMFDQGLAGPLAGLAVALPVVWIGILQLGEAPPPARGLCFHNPLIFQWMIDYLKPDYARPGMAPGAVLCLAEFNPCLMAGYVGMLITGLNMLPIGQLDGGHVSYALLGRRAHVLGRAVLVGSILFVLISEVYLWIVMVVVVTLIGTDHPPTADDHTPLSRPRRILGWASLAIPVLCFHPLIADLR